MIDLSDWKLKRKGQKRSSEGSMNGLPGLDTHLILWILPKNNRFTKDLGLQHQVNLFEHIN